MYASEDGGDSWRKVTFPEGTVVKEELIFHPDVAWKDHVMVITEDAAERQVKHNCLSQVQSCLKVDLGCQ